jgi:alanine dehydrogenase
MNIGIPKERRTFEYRVGMTPTGVQLLAQHGHTIYIEHDAGLGAGFTDTDYEAAGGKITYSPHEVFGRADLLLKVARPMFEEIEWLQPGAVIAGLLHMGSARQDKVDLLLQNRITAIAYEQIELADGSAPIMHALSQIGGRLAAQIGARLLQNNSGGKGILLGGVPGVPPAEVVIVGAGTAGSGAVQSFAHMGAHVTVLDVDINALQHVFDTNCSAVTMISNPVNLARAVTYADIVVGAVRRRGDRPPLLITREMVRSMKPRSVIMDLSIDEGGCVETSRPTTHERSTFIEEGVIHYCVPNVPSVVARTATYAFLNAAFPFIQQLADGGAAAANANPAIEKAIATSDGKMRHMSRLTPADFAD